MDFSYRIRKVYKYLVMLIIGAILILNGLFQMFIGAFFSNSISDEEVVKRAKALGYVDMKAEIIKQLNDGGVKSK